MSNNLIVNSLSNVAFVFLNIAVVFVMTPVILVSLGNHDYGIWEIMMSVIGYMGLLQFGIPPAIVRYVAKYSALNDKVKLNKIFSTSFLIVTFTGVICSVLLLIWAYIYPEAIAEKGVSVRKYFIFLIIISVSVTVMFNQMFVQSFHEGFQRYFLVRAITAIIMIATNIFLYIMLKNGYGLIFFAFINTAANLLKTLIYYFLLMLPKFGGYYFKIKDISISTLRELYEFGFKSFMLGLAGSIKFQTDSIVIGIFLNPSIVPFYIIPVNMLNKVKTIGMSITLTFMPHFSVLNAKGEDDKAVAEFLVYSKYIVGIMTCIFLSVFFLGAQFIELWIGSKYSKEGQVILYIIGLSFLIYFLNPLCGRILTSKGKHGILAYLGIYEALLNLCLSIVLVNNFGKEGVAFATLISAIVFFPIILQKVSKLLGLNTWQYLREVIIPQLFPVLLTTIIYNFLYNYLIPNNYIKIGIMTIILALIYFLLFIRLSCSKHERNFFFSIFRITAVQNK
ncbi:flippase [Desulfosarcina widdelii]|uniref:Flippase n=1 Tax=Desulfosarcina widdelii TaxID=947919 RepID=A0A5K7YT11_9BACT|nr:oligosaccharide flippase family protein [Desulfosarcina widdelii]BBO72972.1 flippase [Desulfosarcina widdelii]